jgi:hypothetical protein
LVGDDGTWSWLTETLELDETVGAGNRCIKGKRDVPFKMYKRMYHAFPIHCVIANLSVDLMNQRQQ